MERTYSAHVQCPQGSGYMLGGGRFTGTEDEARAQAVKRYLELVDKDDNPFGRLALERCPFVDVLLIDGRLRGPGMMAATGFCSVWNEDGSDAYDTFEPDYVRVPVSR